jgi:hypothetical protein
MREDISSVSGRRVCPHVLSAGAQKCAPSVGSIPTTPTGKFTKESVICPLLSLSVIPRDPLRHAMNLKNVLGDINPIALTFMVPLRALNVTNRFYSSRVHTVGSV